MGRTVVDSDLKDQLKQRLCESISAHIDLIGYVPADIAKLVKDFTFDTGTLGKSEAPPPRDDDDKDSLANRVNAYYDHAFYNRAGIMGEVIGESDYRNIGYWNESTTTQNEASERLQDALLDFIPEKTGRILDVACGMGASTRRLLNHYAPESVWAINISAKQIESTKKNAPGCHAMVMNAVDLAFDDGFFDNILCIEAAFHFETRRKFLENARRVLKPGGRLVLSDVLFTSKDRLAQYPVFPSPENHLEDAGAYRTLLADMGFRDVVVNDVTNEVWRAHFLYMTNALHEKFYDGAIDIVRLTELLWTYYQLNAITGPCLFVCARK
jgi:MPBQ/MSBQ methyltransferase